MTEAAAQDVSAGRRRLGYVSDSRTLASRVGNRQLSIDCNSACVREDWVLRRERYVFSGVWAASLDEPVRLRSRKSVVLRRIGVASSSKGRQLAAASLLAICFTHEQLLLWPYFVPMRLLKAAIGTGRSMNRLLRAP